MAAGWESVPLGEVLRPALEPHAVDPIAKYPIAGVYGFGRGMIKRPPTTGQEIAAPQLFRIKAGQFIYSRLKSFEGAFAIVSEDVDGFFVSSEFPTFDTKPSRLDPRYLGWYFKQKRVWQALASDNKGIGARRERLHPDRLLEHEVPLPSVDEQRRIVGRIDALATKIAEARKLGEAAAADTTGLLVAMAHRNDLSRDAKIRDGWRPVELGEIIDEFSDSQPVQPDLSYPNCGIYSFGRGLFAKAPISGLETSAQRLYRVRAGLFIYSRLFAFEGAYGLVDDEFDGFFVSNEYPMFACKADRVRPEFLAAYFRAPGIWRSIAEGSSGLGDRRQRVQPAQLLRHQLLLPPMVWQQKIAEVRRGVTAYAAVHSDTAPQLNALLPAILDRAFKGEL